MGAFTIDFDDELTPQETEYIGGAIKGLVDRLLDARKLAPHVIRHTPKAISAKDGGGTRDAVTDCPDCTRGLSSGMYNGIPVRFCARIDRPPYPEGLKPTPHDIIACGGNRAT